MKRLLEIFIIIISGLFADSLDTDVDHVIIDHKGNAIVAIIDSIPHMHQGSRALA